MQTAQDGCIDFAEGQADTPALLEDGGRNQKKPLCSGLNWIQNLQKVAIWHLHPMICFWEKWFEGSGHPLAIGG